MASAKCSSACSLSGASHPANADFDVRIDERCFETDKKDAIALIPKAKKMKERYAL